MLVVKQNEQFWIKLSVNQEACTCGQEYSQNDVDMAFFA